MTLVFLLISMSVPQGSGIELLDHAFEQWRSTPEMRVEDAYKWLFHATLGGEHAVQDVGGPRNWMDRE